MRISLIPAWLSLLAALLVTSCVKEGEEPRYRPTQPEVPDSVTVQDALGPLSLETRVAPGLDPVISGTLNLSQPYDSLWIFGKFEYQGEEAGHDSEVVAIGLIRSGETSIRWAVANGCIGVPDTQWDLDPNNDEGEFERFAGVVLPGPITQPTQFSFAFAHAIGLQGSCFETGTASWPNDVGIASVTAIGFRKVAIP